MKSKKYEAIEKAGFKVCNTKDFLGLTPDEVRMIEDKIKALNEEQKKNLKNNLRLKGRDPRGRA
jgi:hypothetical protein